jgi:hypothetical protein
VRLWHVLVGAIPFMSRDLLPACVPLLFMYRRRPLNSILLLAGRQGWCGGVW